MQRGVARGSVGVTPGSGDVVQDMLLLEKGVRSIARALFRELVSSGYQPRHVILLSAELIEQVTKAMQRLRGEPTDSH